MIKINTQSTDIPVDINGIQFTIDGSDEGLKAILEKAGELGKRTETIDEKDEAAVEKIIVETFEFILGEGSYKKIAKKVKSRILQLEILAQLANGVANELNKRMPTLTQAQLAQQFVKHNKPKDKKKKKQK